MSGLDRWLDAFWGGMAVHLWQTALFVVALAGVAWLLRNASARITTSLYWIGVIKLLLPLPVLGPLSHRLGSSLFDVAPEAVVAPAAGWTATVGVWMYPVLPDSTSTGTIPSGWLGVVTAVWLAGAALALLRLASRRPGSPELRERLGRVVEQAGVEASDFRWTDGEAVPAVHGLLRPRIVIPLDIARGLEDVELRGVLIHEQEHLRRRDPLRYAFLGVVHSVFWFYPPVWWLARRIRETTELACDEAVVRGGISPRIYCRSLARALQLGLGGTPEGSPVGILGHRVSFLRLRFERIRSSRRYEAMLSHRVLLLAVLVAALGVSLIPLAPSMSHAGGKTGDTVPTVWTGLESADLPVMAEFDQLELEAILDMLEKTSGVTFRVAAPLPQGPFVFESDRRPLREVLEKLAHSARIRFEVTGPRSIDVYPIHIAGMSDVSVPTLIPSSRVRPEYPEDARIHRTEGRVVLQALVDHNGIVNELEVLSSTPAGYRPFIDSASKAVRQWRYEPATRDGAPVAVYFTVMVEFSLKPASAPGELPPV
jgi:TonB family protein